MGGLYTSIYAAVASVAVKRLRQRDGLWRFIAGDSGAGEGEQTP